jgi:formylglycine-generating enzyme required for sulfatase activity
VDYAAFTKTNPGVGGNWEAALLDVRPLVGEPFDQHPIAKVSRPDAEAFCKWLSLQSPHRYRLPTDAEWSLAADFDEPRSKSETPDDLHNKALSGSAARIYPWGREWPPPARAGNYGGAFTPSADTFPTTAPVMTFQPNKHGLYDIGGNLWEWVSDLYWNKQPIYGTLRGGGWLADRETGFRSGCRFGGRQGATGKDFGFRIVLEPPTASSASSVPASIPASQTAAPVNPAPAISPATVSKDKPFVNSLGMKFVPVPGTKVLFSIWHTRVQDYEKFVLETQRSYKAPENEQGPTHPVINIKWEDAKAFCDWLSRKEGLEYRLPQDAEWSTAAGDTVYPWGNDNTVPKGFGNFSGAHRAESFAFTTPVGSFSADKHGLFDMAGNAFQWCEDIYDPSLNEPFTLEKFPSLKKAKPDDGSVWHVTRGSSWGFQGLFGLRTSFRQHSVGGTGFRCVIVIGSTAAPASATPAPP